MKRARPILTLFVLSMLAASGAVSTGCKTTSGGDSKTQETPEGSDEIRTRRHVHKAVPTSSWAGEMELAATFDEQMPTGLAVADDSRIFVNFPRWEDGVKYTVGVVEDGQLQAYPDMSTNRFDPEAPTETFSSVQSVRIGPRGKLWVLDTGRPKFKPTDQAADKLVAIDIQSDEIVRTITFPDDVVRKTTYLNDVRFDMTRGKPVEDEHSGFAFITDSSGAGDNGIIVVNLENGKSWRHLDRHTSTRAADNFVPMVEGRPLMNRPAEGPPSPMTIGSDGITIGPEAERLYFRVLSGRGLYSIAVDKLTSPDTPTEEIEETLVSHGPLPFASDGLEMTANGHLVLTNYEDNGVVTWKNGELETLAYDPRLLWPDSLDVESGAVYVTANQLHRQPGFHGGEDLRETPYAVYKIEADVDPVVLK